MTVRVAPYLVAACVLAAAAGSSIQRQLFDVGRPARWVLLAALVAYALVVAWPRRHALRFPPRTALALAAFCGLALVSIAWSVHARGTAERAVVQAAVVAALVALVALRADDVGLGLVDGVVAASGIVAAAGFLYWVISPSQAVLHATTEYGSRFQGIEQSPNTAPALYSIALPLAFGRMVSAQGRLRLLLGAVVLALAASLAASGSRGGLLGAYAGVFAVCALAPLTWRRRFAIAAAAAVALTLSAVAFALPKSLPAKPLPTPTHTVTSPVAEAVLPLEQEIGNPWWTRRQGDAHRSLFSTSVRLRALRGSVQLALERPLLGFGFGAEQWAFFNRYYAFNSGNPENGYVGILLQTGIVGLVLFLVAVGACVRAGLTTWFRRARSPVLLAAVGGATGALVLGISESYFHGVGSIEWLPFWITLLVCAGAARVGA